MKRFLVAFFLLCWCVPAKAFDPPILVANASFDGMYDVADGWAAYFGYISGTWGVADVLGSWQEGLLTTSGVYPRLSFIGEVWRDFDFTLGHVYRFNSLANGILTFVESSGSDLDNMYAAMNSFSLGIVKVEPDCDVDSNFLTIVMGDFNNNLDWDWYNTLTYCQGQSGLFKWDGLSGLDDTDAMNFYYKCQHGNPVIDGGGPDEWASNVLAVISSGFILCSEDDVSTYTVPGNYGWFHSWHSDDEMTIDGTVIERDGWIFTPTPDNADHTDYVNLYYDLSTGSALYVEGPN